MPLLNKKNITRIKIKERKILRVIYLKCLINYLFQKVLHLLNTFVIHFIYPRILGSSHFFIAITGKEYPAHPTYSKICSVEKP